MTFINWPILLALSGISIPILIHLFNRRHATPMDWGAMRFLLASITSRKRRILIEEILLMSMRCMLVALLVLTVARPFLPSRTSIPWVIVLPTVLAASVCAAVGSSMWSQKRARTVLLLTAALLLLIAGSATAMEYWSQTQLWAGGTNKDVAIIIDASASMTLETDGKTNFQRAVEEASELIKTRRRGDAFSIILAGAGPDAVVPSPISNGEELQAALEAVEPMGASLNLAKAIAAATDCLERGNGAAKAVVIISDGQKLGWNVKSSDQWDLAAAGFKSFPTAPLILCRDLPASASIDNASLGEITFDRSVIGADRPVGIDVKILNAGQAQIPSAAVELHAGGVIAGTETAEAIPPQAAKTVHFDHLFDAPGPQVVTARIIRTDDISGDNESHRVVTVAGKLPVLIIDGNPDGLDAKLLRIALTPRDTDVRDQDQKFLIAPTTVPVAEIAAWRDFANHRVVALVDVPRIPESVAKALEVFVTNGGGLLVVPGKHAVPEFYNEWIDARRRNFMPAKLLERKIDLQKPARPSVETFRHPALNIVGNLAYSDMDKAAVSAWWRLAPRATASIGGDFSSSEPMMVERQLDKGRVIVLATSLSVDDSNLPRLECFVLLMHELAYYLAAGSGDAATGSLAGAPVVMELTADGADPLKLEKDQKVTVTGPGGLQFDTKTTLEKKGLRIRFDETLRPGLYGFALPPSLAGRFKDRTSADGKTLPFAVFGDPGEGFIERLSPEDYDHLETKMGVFHAETFSQLSEGVRGRIPGQELWKYLALGLLALIIGEVALTRWICARRGAGTEQSTSFGQEGGDLQTLRRRAQKALSSAASQ